MAGSAESIALPFGVSPRVPVAKSLQSSPDLRLTAYHNEYEDTLERVDHIRDVPHVLRTTHCPGDYVQDPGNSHDDHQLHADSAQGGSVTQFNRRSGLIEFWTFTNFILRKRYLNKIERDLYQSLVLILKYCWCCIILFWLRLESSSVRIYFYKKYKGKNFKIARMTDKHCGKNDIKELHVWNYKIGLNN